MINFKLNDDEKKDKNEIKVKTLLDKRGTLRLRLVIDEIEETVFAISNDGQAILPKLTDEFIDKAKEAGLVIKDGEIDVY